jgi:hypothetical protein
MLAFIVPLRSSASTKNWPRVCSLYKRTLKSICQQTNNNFVVVVVCSEVPEIGFNHSSLEFVKVDFSVEEANSEDAEGLKNMRELDKARRMWVGLRFLSSLEHISHIMFVDADDCVSMNLVDFVDSRNQSAGWYINSGYSYPEGKRIIYPVRRDLCDKTNTDVDFEEVDSGFLFHHNVRSIMSGIGHPLQPFPFPAVTYVTDNGENMYMQRSAIFQYKTDYLQLFRVLGGSLKRFLIQRPLTESICREFGIYQLNTHNSSTAKQMDFQS